MGVSDDIEEVEDGVLDVDSSNDCTCDGVPEVGMVFKTHTEVSIFYSGYADRVGFGVSVRRSSFTKEGLCLYLELVCCKGGGNKRAEPKSRKRTSATTNCPARIRVKLWADGLLHLELASLDHNHPVSPAVARRLRCKRQLSGFAKKSVIHDDVCAAENVGKQQEQVSVCRLDTMAELLFGESECRSFVERGRLKFREGDAEAIRLFFTRMQAKNSNFFSVIDLDDEGCVRNVFWADARSRAAYEYYNDVIALDTAYVTNRYDVPLATFEGVNHHGQPVLLGCALLSDETAETYLWLLKAWIACMSGYLPKAIITDHLRSIQIAVSVVLPGVRHRMCLWQIMKRVSERLAGLSECRAIHRAMQKAVYDSLSVEEFEMEWRKMIDLYGLQGNEWLSSLDECRYSWAPVYLKDAFWAGLSTMQRNESLNTFFDGYVDAKTSLKKFLGKYDMALQSRHEKEAQADFETFHKRRPPVSKFYMEEQLSIVYTLNIFKKFQDEIEGILYCHASLVKVEGSISTLDVKECIFLDDGKRSTYKNHSVLYNSEEKDVQCICGYFQLTGILCRHALSVFKLQQVHEIPPQYILDRWKKDFKRLHVLNRFSADVVSNNGISRYDHLSMRCIQLVEVGVLSDKYVLALKLIKEMEKFLLSDSTHEGTQPKIIARADITPKSDSIGIESMGSATLLEKETEKRRRRGCQVKDSQEGVNSNALPHGSHNPLQLLNNQAPVRPSIVYMFPGGFDQHAFTNGVIMPWMYHQMFQVASKQPKDLKDPAVLFRNQTAKRKRVNHRSYATQEVKDSPGPPPAPPPPPGS